MEPITGPSCPPATICIDQTTLGLWAAAFVIGAVFLEKTGVADKLSEAVVKLSMSLRGVKAVPRTLVRESHPHGRDAGAIFLALTSAAAVAAITAVALNIFITAEVLFAGGIVLSAYAFALISQHTRHRMGL